MVFTRPTSVYTEHITSIHAFHFGLNQAEPQIVAEAHEDIVLEK